MPFRKEATLILLLLSAPLASAAAAETPLPATLAAPGETIVLTAHAVGMQTYECKAGTDGKLAWAFREPVATLIADDKIVGRHFAGPTWQLSDGSAVVGRVAASTPGAMANDIAWLKLDVVSRSGDGMLSNVTTVQRMLLQEWMLNCQGLGMTFEIVPVVPSKDTREVVATFLDSK